MQGMSDSNIQLTLGKMLTSLLIREVKLVIRLSYHSILNFKKLFSEVFRKVDIFQSFKILYFLNRPLHELTNFPSVIRGPQ